MLTKKTTTEESAPMREPEKSESKRENFRLIKNGHYREPRPAPKPRKRLAISDYDPAA